MSLNVFKKERTQKQCLEISSYFSSSQRTHTHTHTHIRPRFLPFITGFSEKALIPKSSPKSRWPRELSCTARKVFIFHTGLQKLVPRQSNIQQTSNTKHKMLSIYLHSGSRSSAIASFHLRLLRLGVALETDKHSKPLLWGSSVARQPGHSPSQGISPLNLSYASGLLEQGVLDLLACFPF